MNATEQLNEKLEKTVTSYPDGTQRIDSKIKGLAFFPGGDGLFTKDDTNHEKAAFPIGGIMVLGQDFDSKNSYEASLKQNFESRIKNKTWVNLLQILKATNIDPEECFYTNAIMGVRTTGKSTGRSPGFNCDTFISQCRKFLIEQIRIQKPKLIITLGIQVPSFLSAFSNELAALSEVNSWKKLDEKGLHIFKQINIGDVKTNVVFITHPSLYHSNVKRRFRNSTPDLNGKELEKALIKEVLT